MSTLEINTKIDRKYLMNKSKEDLARMVLDLTDILADERKINAEYEITAAYFPMKREADITFLNRVNGKYCSLEIKDIDDKAGQALSEVVLGSIYHYGKMKATLKDSNV